MIIMGKKPGRGLQDGAGRAPRLTALGDADPLQPRWNERRQGRVQLPIARVQASA